MFGRLRREWWQIKGTGRSNWPRLRGETTAWAGLLGEDLEAVGLGPKLPPSVRKVTARRIFAVTRANQFLLAGALSVMCAAALLAVVVGIRTPAETWTDTLPLFYPGVFLCSWPPLWRLWVSCFAKGRLWEVRRSVPVALSLRAIGFCAYVVTSPPGSRAAEAGEVSGSLRLVERAVLRSPRRTGTVPRSSPRRRQLTLHTRLVVAALRRAELGLDTDPAAAARELSRLLLTVAENCAEGRLAALLPEEELKDLEPVRDHTVLTETLHLVGALLVVGAVGWAGTWYGAGIGVETPWSLIPAAITAVLVFPRLRTAGPDLLVSYLGP